MLGKPVVHFEIGCKDKDKTSEFYGKLFDWSTTSYGPASTGVSTDSDSGIDGHITALGHEPHNYVIVYVEVEDIPAYLEKAEALGGNTVIGATEVPDEGHFAWVEDPEGNMFGLWQPKS
jgi:predicted enzyme related to lactoylglutathione lyase